MEAVRGAPPPPPTNNFLNAKLTPTNNPKLIGKGIFILDNKNILISRLDEQLPGNAPQWLHNENKFQT